MTSAQYQNVAFGFIFEQLVPVRPGYAGRVEDAGELAHVERKHVALHCKSVGFLGRQRPGMLRFNDSCSIN